MKEPLSTPALPIRSGASVALLAAILVAAMLVGPAALPAGAQTSRSSAPGPSFEWSMPDRYGIDNDLDGLVDMPNTAAYVHGTTESNCVPTCPAATFPVLFEARLGDGVPPTGLPLITYEWTIVPAHRAAQSHTRRAAQMRVSLPEGRTEVTLRVILDLPFRRFTVTTSDVIDIQDVLIVAIGDSYASGEGNPERRRDGPAETVVWGDGIGNQAVEADHAAARRSSLAWTSQMAIDLERRDPHSSVTFISVAASSATVAKGLLGAQNNRLPEAQIPRVAQLVGEREIDMLLVTIGGNDIGFSRLIAGLVDADPWLDPICYETDLTNTWDSVEDGQWNRISRLAWKITDPFRVRCRSERTVEGHSLAGLDGLPGELDRMAAAITESLDPGAVLVMEYPDPTGFSEGPEAGICDEIVGDAAPLGLHEINREEQRLGRSEVLDPLNAAIEAAATRHGWHFVSGVVDAFTDGHGYCADWPDYGYPPEFLRTPTVLQERLDHPDGWYRNGGLNGTDMITGPVSWYRTAGQSVVLQGPDSRVDTTGTMHPNELGHRAMANLALAVLSRR